MGKKIKKIVNKATGGVAGSILGEDEKKAEAATVVAAPASPAASVVEAPKDEANTDAETDTEASKKKAQASGKRSLQVSRSAGSGLNI